MNPQSLDRDPLLQTRTPLATARGPREQLWPAPLFCPGHLHPPALRPFLRATCNCADIALRPSRCGRVHAAGAVQMRTADQSMGLACALRVALEAALNPRERVSALKSKITGCRSCTLAALRLLSEASWPLLG